MSDLDTLLARLRQVASELPDEELLENVQHRPWSPVGRTTVRQALLESSSTIPSQDHVLFLVSDAEDFVLLAFLSYLGRTPDAVGRSHYLGLLQQGRPRLEVLAELAGSDEAVGYRGRPRWPLWLYALLRAMRLPSGFARRAGRAVLRRVEARLAGRARRSPAGLVWRLACAIDERESLRDAEIDRLEGDLQAQRQTSGARFSRFEERLAHAESVLAQHATAQAATRARIAVIEQTGVSQPRAHEPAPQAAAQTIPDVLTRYYLTLEAAFRGSPDAIREQLRHDYVRVMEDARIEAGNGPCIDLGCGRGEWLDVLRENAFDARGVDLNPYLAAEARSRGHDVVVADALSFLRDIEGDSVLAISAFHLAEHLPFAALYQLIGEARRVLRPNGRLILETPNPENIWVATHTFHHDPTHGNPLTPASLEFLVNHHGLETISVLRLHPYPEDARLPGDDPVSARLNGMTCGPQDFAIVAKKTPAL